MRSVALALAYLATGIHALPRPAVSYAVVNVDGGSAPTSTEAAQTTVISTVVESEAPTTVSEVVYKTVTDSSATATTVSVKTVTETPSFRNLFSAIIAKDIAIISSIVIVIVIAVSININIVNKHHIARVGTLIGYIICRFVLDRCTGVIFKIICISHRQEQHNHKRRVLDTQQQQLNNNTISINQLDCIRATSSTLNSSSLSTSAVSTIVVVQTQTVVPAQVAPTSTSYYDNGMWHTSYVVKNFPTLAPSAAGHHWNGTSHRG
ncbi:hypothetical protein KCU91_g9941, partial [Aureobasidium melanogenum]